MTSYEIFLKDESGAAVVDVSVVLAVVLVTLGIALVIRGSNVLEIIARFADVL